MTGDDLVEGGVEGHQFLDQAAILDAVVGYQPGVPDEQNLHQPANRFRT